MKKMTFIVGIASLAVLAGCSKSDDQTIPTVGSDEIRAVAKALSIDASTQEAKTRAAYTASDAKNLKAYVLTSQTTGDYTTQYAAGTMTFDATDAANIAVGYETNGFTGNKKLPADKSSLFLAALYPATAWGTATTTASYTFTGTQDVMAAPQTEIKKGGTEVAAFAFAHLLTKLDITVKAADADAIAAWGKVQKIEITKVVNGTAFKDKVAVTLADGKALVATAFSQSTSLTSWKTYTSADAEFASQDIALTTSAVPVATTIMAPFTAVEANTDLEVSVTTKTTSGSAQVTKVAITVPAGDTQGKQYTINLNFIAKDIKGTATVATWGSPVVIDKDVE